MNQPQNLCMCLHKKKVKYEKLRLDPGIEFVCMFLYQVINLRQLFYMVGLYGCVCARTIVATHRISIVKGYGKIFINALFGPFFSSFAVGQNENYMPFCVFPMRPFKKIVNFIQYVTDCTIYYKSFLFVEIVTVRALFRENFRRKSSPQQWLNPSIYIIIVNGNELPLSQQFRIT